MGEQRNSQSWKGHKLYLLLSLGNHPVLAPECDFCGLVKGLTVRENSSPYLLSQHNDICLPSILQESGVRGSLPQCALYQQVLKSGSHFFRIIVIYI
jgi:hypothetical protein